MSPIQANQHRAADGWIGPALAIGSVGLLCVAGWLQKPTGSRAPVDVSSLLDQILARRKAEADPMKEGAPQPPQQPSAARPPRHQPKADKASAAPQARLKGGGGPMAPTVARGAHVRIQDASGRHHVSHHRDGTWSCTCRAWVAGERPCAHIRQAQGGQVPTAAAPAAAPPKTSPRIEVQALPAGDPEVWSGVMKAERWSQEIDPRGYWMSEKFNGYRGYWDGQRLLSKNGNVFAAPPWFTAPLPRGVPLDGELYLGPNRLDELGFLRAKSPDHRWNEVKFKVFDAPGPGDFESRMVKARAAVERACAAYRGPGACPYAAVEHIRCESEEHLMQLHREIVRRGGEGVILRAPRSPYLRNRSHLFLKVKDLKDAEAKIVGYSDSKTHPGTLGAYLVEDLDSRERFKVGIGLNTAGRARPLALGSIVTYAYRDTTSRGVPRGAIFVRERAPE